MKTKDGFEVEMYSDDQSRFIVHALLACHHDFGQDLAFLKGSRRSREPVDAGLDGVDLD